jgi:hypothetical protein
MQPSATRPARHQRHNDNGQNDNYDNHQDWADIRLTRSGKAIHTDFIKIVPHKSPP